MTSIWVPFAYITVLVGAKISATEPWFPTHQARDLYITLLQADPPAPEKILMSALLCRAVTDVKRIWQLRDSKNALNILVQKGSLGDETVARFAAAEKELEAEVVDVVAEANTFKQGWGQWIFASASEIAQREKLKGVLEEMPKIKQEQDRIYAAIKAKHQAPAPPPPYTATASSTPQATSIPAGKATSTALESPTEGLVHRAAASVGAEKADEEISSGASTPQKGGATSGKNTPGSAKKKGKRK